MQNPAFQVAKFSWIAVAREVSRLTGKTYRPCYIREVATGYRPNKSLEPILKKMGFLTEVAA